MMDVKYYITKVWYYNIDNKYIEYNKKLFIIYIKYVYIKLLTIHGTDINGDIAAGGGAIF